MALDASGKFAMSISAASVKSSSSRSSSESWHPSQDANFQTASLGRCLSAMLNLPDGKDARDAVEPQNRAIFAGKFGTELAAAASPHGAFHVAFHGEVDAFFWNPRVTKGAGHVPHLALRAANHRERLLGIEIRALYEGRHLYASDIAAPAAIRVVDGHEEINVEPLTPLLELMAIEQIFGAVEAEEDRDASIMLAIVQDMVDGGPQRREAAAAGDHDDVQPFSLVNRPARSERTTNAEDIALFQSCQRAARHPNVADRMHVSAHVCRIAAHADGHFAHAEHVEHVELAGRKRRPLPRQGRDVDRHDIRDLGRRADHTIEFRQKRVRQRLASHRFVNACRRRRGSEVLLHEAVLQGWVRSVSSSRSQGDDLLRISREDTQRPCRWRGSTQRRERRTSSGEAGRARPRQRYPRLATSRRRSARGRALRSQERSSHAGSGRTRLRDRAHGTGTAL